MQKIILKPCPFCGSEALLRSGIITYLIECKNYKCGIQTMQLTRQKRVIETWNKRTDTNAKDN